MLTRAALAVPVVAEEDAAPVGETTDAPAAFGDAVGTLVAAAVTPPAIVDVAVFAAGVLVAALPPPQAARMPAPAATAAIPLKRRRYRRLNWWAIPSM